MRVIYADLWDLYKHHPDPICITTNGAVNRRGEAVMGRGCAREMAQRFPHFPRQLAGFLGKQGNHVGWFNPERVFTFPVKHRWHQRADLELIERSAIELMSAIRCMDFVVVYLPKPGCGNGNLDWKYEVEPVLDEICDHRVVAVDFA